MQDNFFDSFARISVPLFVILSGSLLLHKKDSLKVFYKNVKAIGFYEKKGFKSIGTETTDIGNSYIILDNVMSKKI